MFQPKARRIVPVVALFAALSLVPLADASAARARAPRSKPAARVSLLVQVAAQLASFWDALVSSTLAPSAWSDAGVRMDDNG